MRIDHVCQDSFMRSRIRGRHVLAVWATHLLLAHAAGWQIHRAGSYVLWRRQVAPTHPQRPRLSVKPDFLILQGSHFHIRHT